MSRRPGRREPDPVLEADLRRAYEQGLSDEEIGAKVHLSPQSVVNWRLARGLKSKGSRRRRESETLDREIRRRRAKGESAAKIALAIGKSMKTVRARISKLGLPSDTELRKQGAVLADGSRRGPGERTKDQAGRDRRACRGCAYFRGTTWKTCTWIEIHGSRRPCPPGEGCTERTVGPIPIPRKIWTLADDPTAWMRSERMEQEG